MDSHTLASCFSSCLTWLSSTDLAAIATAFSADHEPDPQALGEDARRRLLRWKALSAGGSARSEAERVWLSVRATGADVLHPFHPDYPEAFRCLEKPPSFLSRLGASPWVGGACLSIFGGREPSDEALSWMRAHLPEVFQATGAFVASGGARGVDQTAHGLSLASGRPTAIFLPSGLQAPFPSEIARWFPRVLSSGGAVLSEFLPERIVRKSCFERRNRMIAAMGHVAFAIEGRRRSGTTMTLRLACDLGKAVAALPGHPMDSRCAGTLDALRDGATLIRDSHDLICLLAAEAARDYAHARRNENTAAIENAVLAVHIAAQGGA